VDARRLAAFTKRLMQAALAADSGEAMGCLALVNRLLRRHPKLRSMLEHERSGTGACRLAERSVLSSIKQLCYTSLVDQSLPALCAELIINPGSTSQPAPEPNPNSPLP